MGGDHEVALTQISDVRDDRLSVSVESGCNHTQSSTVTRGGVTVVRMGRPEYDDALMCAKCVGECKIF
jgi:hypothetical protein